MTRELRARIERALTGQELTVLYQPIVDLATGMPVGYEALSRFTLEPTQPPDRWFADADAAGLRPQLELLAFGRALDGLALLPPDCHLAINASPATALTPEFAERLSGAPLDRIVLEITEHAPIHDYHTFERGLRELRRHGLRLAIDDAGAGFASLRHILELSPEIIKLDRTVTADVDSSRPTRALAAALTSFAWEIQATVVAEGIERHIQAAVVRALGVTQGQGYHLGQPAPPPHAATSRPTPQSASASPRRAARARA